MTPSCRTASPPVPANFARARSDPISGAGAASAATVSAVGWTVARAVDRPVVHQTC
ncbi:hypothetical protein ACFSGX_01625 [Sphingomonas arantia]|uniref:Uncharacterized protein n=1 Tax=Sphingomonas arantia TaxID=1460676 RepID=A0ABW4TU96_9SPHN